MSVGANIKKEDLNLECLNRILLRLWDIKPDLLLLKLNLAKTMFHKKTPEICLCSRHNNRIFDFRL